jgi:two-component system, NarL family, response regulator NreC
MSNSKKKGVLIVDDQTLIREGLRLMLSSLPDLEVVGEAGDGREAIRVAENLSPNLILMDLSMPRMGGVEAIREIKKSRPKIKILALTVNDSEEHVAAALQAGADGYVLKDSTREELLRAIQYVLVGKKVLSPSIVEKVIEGYLSGKKPGPPQTRWDTLTNRQKEILKLIGEGYTNKKIADYLCISTNTAEKHRSNLMEKLNLHSVAALTSYAIEKGLVVK